MSELRELLGMQESQSTAIREAIRDELDAVNKYNKYISESISPDVIKVLSDIRDEEKVHIGELLRILTIVEPQEEGFHAEGKQEVDDLVVQARTAIGQAEGD